MFWGGLPPGNANVLETLNVFSDTEVTLEFTHGGSLLNGLCFCGSTDIERHPDGFNYNSCPWDGVMSNYWVFICWHSNHSLSCRFPLVEQIAGGS